MTRYGYSNAELDRIERERSAPSIGWVKDGMPRRPSDPPPLPEWLRRSREGSNDLGRDLTGRVRL